MPDVRLIKIREEILSEDKDLAVGIRRRLSERGVFLLNLMSSPGAGKTSLILETAGRLGDGIGLAVVEADLDSTVDADKIASAGIPATQIETGGFCHVSAAMMEKALEGSNIAKVDLLILENVGNLVCPAQTDTGAHLDVVILSVPEGDDKPLKYPLIFTKVDAVVVNKTDYLAVADFDVDAFFQRIRVLNPGAATFSVSCKTGEGIDTWVRWLEDRILSERRPRGA